MKVMIILSILILFMPYTAHSENQEIPYTAEALNKLYAAKKSEPDTSQADQVDIKAKLYIDYQRKIFDKAGYDFDKSIVKYLHDIKKGEEYIKSKSSISSPLSYLKICIIQLNNFKQKVDLSQYLSKELTEELADYGNIHSMKQTEVLNKVTSDNKTKTQHYKSEINEILKRYQGFYEQSLRGFGGYEEQGEANIQIASASHILFSFNSKLITNYITRGLCSMENKTAPFSSAGRGNSFTARFEENDCRLDMHFRINTKGIEMFTITQIGSCLSYCTQGRKLNQGVFTKKTSQDNTSNLIKDEKAQHDHEENNKQQIAKSWFEKAIKYNATGNYSEAINALNKSIEFYPKATLAFYARGSIFFSIGNYQQAINNLDKTIELRAEFAPAYNVRGLSYKNLGNRQQAIQDLNKAIELDSKYAIAYYNRGTLYEELGNTNASTENYKIAAKLGMKEAQDILSKMQQNQTLPETTK